MADIWQLNRDGVDAAVEAVVQCLERGELAVIPTETVYGLVADPRVPGSVERIYAAKQRDRGKPLQMLVSSSAVIEAMGFELTDIERRLADRFWPGALTLIVEADGRSEGFRVPDSKVALAVIKKAGGALRGTSANLSGEPPALTAEEALECLGDSVSAVLDGGHVVGGVASTVVRIDHEGRIELLREGGISRESIEAAGRNDV